MELSEKMRETLLEINCGAKPRLKSAYNKNTIDALESRGLLVVRDYDGEIRITIKGENYLDKIKEGIK